MHNKIRELCCMIGIFTRKCKKELSKNKVDNINWNEINMVKRMLGYFNTNVSFQTTNK